MNYIFQTRINWLSDYEFNDLCNLFITTLLFSILSTLLSGFRTDPLHSLGVEYCFITKINMLSWNTEDEFMNHPIHLWGAPYGNISVLLSLNNSAAKSHCTRCKCLFLECFGIDILTSYVNQVAFRKFLPSTIQSPYKLHPSAPIAMHCLSWQLY